MNTAHYRLGSPSDDDPKLWSEIVGFTWKAVKLNDNHYLDAPVSLSFSMRALKDAFGGQYRFKGTAEEVSKHLANSVLRTVSSTSYEYTPYKNYSKEIKKAQEGRISRTPAEFAAHKHLWETARLAQSSGGAVNLYGITYTARGFDNYYYGAYQYYGDSSWERDTSLHTKARSRWLDPLINEDTPERREFIDHNARWLKDQFVKITREAMRLGGE